MLRAVAVVLIVATAAACASLERDREDWARPDVPLVTVRLENMNWRNASLYVHCGYASVQPRRGFPIRDVPPYTRAAAAYDVGRCTDARFRVVLSVGGGEWVERVRNLRPGAAVDITVHQMLSGTHLMVRH